MTSKSCKGRGVAVLSPKDATKNKAAGTFAEITTLSTGRNKGKNDVAWQKKTRESGSESD
jgi:hypothetical protein